MRDLFLKLGLISLGVQPLFHSSFTGRRWFEQSVGRLVGSRRSPRHFHDSLVVSFHRYFGCLRKWTFSYLDWQCLAAYFHFSPSFCLSVVVRVCSGMDGCSECAYKHAQHGYYEGWWSGRESVELRSFSRLDWGGEANWQKSRLNQPNHSLTWGSWKNLAVRSRDLCQSCP